MLKSIKLPKVAGQIVANDLSLESLITLGTAAEYMYEGQRHHGKTNRRKTHTKGVLKGNSQIFSAVWVKALKRLIFIDGYHRVDSLAKGLASFDTNATIRLDVYYADSMAEVSALYDQFNSLAAAKRSQCYFDSGLRECKELNNIVSAQIVKGPKATAVQMAAGLKGSTKTKQAVMKVIDGIRTVNGLDLSHASHEIGGVLGAFFAIAQYCGDKRLVTTFIRNINANTCDFVDPTAAELVMMQYHEELKSLKGSSKTGGAINEAKFSSGLAAFARYAALSKHIRGVSVPVNMTLAQFMDVMSSKFPAKLK